MDIILGVRSSDIGSSEFIVLYGELGSGKSHALRYLKTQIDSDSTQFRSLVIDVERPRVASKLNFLELHKFIITQIGITKFREICQRVEAKVDSIARDLSARAGLSSATNQSTFEEEAINTLNNENSNNGEMVRLLMEGASDKGGVFAYLAGNENRNDAVYRGKIDSDFIAAKVLGDFFRTITSNFGNVEPVYESVYLFVDECEILFDAKVTESDPVFSGFRELINGVPYRFGLVLSFTAATALIEAYMPQHLLKRMTYKFVEVPMLEDEQAIDFLKEHLEWYRPESYSNENNPFYPFTEETMRFVVENQTSLTPRNLFLDCKRILERAIRRYDLKPGEEISAKLAEKIFARIRD